MNDKLKTYRDKRDLERSGEPPGGRRKAGRVGTGFDHARLESLARKLKAIERRRSPYADMQEAGKGVHWVAPKLVAEIGFTEWTRDGRLRHPRFIGLRDDKRATDVVREEPA